MAHTRETHAHGGWSHRVRAGSGSFWGLVMIGIGLVWLLLILLPFIIKFLVPALLVYFGIKLIRKSWFRAR